MIECLELMVARFLDFMPITWECGLLGGYLMLEVWRFS